jgi:hypothetical protein
MPITTSHDEDEECSGCGSSLADREAFGQRNMGTERKPWNCRHCDAMKCCMCDMGDDVGCISCDGASE